MTGRARPTVVFVCTGNSCRSQMAEGWARQLHGTWLDCASAGTAPTRLDPRAVAVMREIGIDISDRHSKHVDELGDAPIDLVVTVCDAAERACPVIPGARRTIHRGFPDPPALALDAATPDDALRAYRRIRDELGQFVESLAAELGQTPRDADR